MQARCAINIPDLSIDGSNHRIADHHVIESSPQQVVTYAGGEAIHAPSFELIRVQLRSFIGAAGDQTSDIGGTSPDSKDWSSTTQLDADLGNISEGSIATDHDQSSYVLPGHPLRQSTRLIPAACRSDVVNHNPAAPA
jgi:hypothetical protein